VKILIVRAIRRAGPSQDFEAEGVVRGGRDETEGQRAFGRRTRQAEIQRVGVSGHGFVEAGHADPA
jgi:hypothetical protein